MLSAASGALLTLGAAQAREPPVAHRSRLILLGTKGGPTPSRYRAPASNVLAIDDDYYVIDAPDGVAQRIVQAGFDLARLGRIFITHNHSDHNAGLGALLILAWGSGLQTPIDIYGPPPIARLVEASLAANDYDIRVRMREEGRPPLAPLIRTHEIAGPGTVLEIGQVKIRCTRCQHYTVPDFAFRFDMPDRSFVFSGDTGPCEALVQLAHGADVLVHEAMLPSELGRIIDKNAPHLLDHILKAHTSTEQLGRIAEAADIRTLVLSHLVPAFPAITDAMWIEGVRSHFRGRIIVGRDMMEL